MMPISSEHAGVIVARDRYGYGSWKAPYWFIGIEEGQHHSENSDLTLRDEAFLKLNKDGLCDCRAFHKEIKQSEWFEGTLPLQTTWRPLMITLFTFLGKSEDLASLDSLRHYQRDLWGAAEGGETCIIELSGLPAKSQKVDRDREAFRIDRINNILKKMGEFRPKFVVIYGSGQKKYWLEAFGLPPNWGDIHKFGSTVIAFTSHPTAPGRTNASWIELGQLLRSEVTP